MTATKNCYAFVLLMVVLIAACSSGEEITGQAAENDIFEPLTQVEDSDSAEAIEEVIKNTTNATTLIEEEQTETVFVETKQEGIFKPYSIISKQYNISLSLDSIKSEIKSEYWGKITEITMTILNNGSKAFKPKVLVLLYDERDFKEDWFKPKAEIGFDIEKLEPEQYNTRQAIVNIAFDDIALTKKFELVLVDATDPANKPLVVVEYDFNVFNATFSH